MTLPQLFIKRRL
uniref:Uncharacterized protein n=1 Tax=Arundo donax TaxID=35708 RepID=A0A0A9BDN7_ARUDO